MYTSSDIKTLFGRFGGDATGYREIRMENEAQEARDRWPLLGMIDLRRDGASAAERSRSQPAVGAAGTGGLPASVGVAAKGPAPSGGAAPPPEHSQAALRRTAPLFARSPRRDVAQTSGKPTPTAPGSGQFRFSPPPGAQASPEVATPPVSNEPVAVPQAAPRTFGAAAFAAKVPPAVAVPAPSPASVAPPAIARGGAPLRKLFGAASASATQQGQPGQQGTASELPASVEGHLDQLFDRLRVGSNPEPVQGRDGSPKAAPWISRGVNGP
jgi:resuscitation-promoting factor RpfA